MSSTKYSSHHSKASLLWPGVNNHELKIYLVKTNIPMSISTHPIKINRARMFKATAINFTMTGERRALKIDITYRPIA